MIVRSFALVKFYAFAILYVLIVMQIKLVVVVVVELDEIAVQRTKGSIIRSRARWYELGEKRNKYFFNFMRARCKKRHITKLKTPEGITAEDPKVILTVMKNFCNQLYISQNQPSAERFSNCLPPSTHVQYSLTDTIRKSHYTTRTDRQIETTR